MAVDINDAFVKQFESEVHMAYQRMGSKLRNTVRSKTNVRVARPPSRRLARAPLAPSRVTATCR